jgi:glucokinase
MYIVFDIGGSSMRIASSEDGKELIGTKVIPTPDTYEVGLSLLVQTAKELANGEEISKVAGGLPGVLNTDRTGLVHARNLSNWNDKPLSTDMALGLKTTVRLMNDASVAALGEAHSGAGKGFERVMYISIGTGYGGAWVVNGELLSGKGGYEPGHQIIDYASSAELESIVSGTALAAKFGTDLQSADIEKLQNEIMQPLVTGLYNSLLHWPSDVIVLGGGVMLNTDISLDILKKELTKLLSSYSPTPEIVKNKLGDKAGLYGALQML